MRELSEACRAEGLRSACTSRRGIATIRPTALPSYNDVFVEQLDGTARRSTGDLRGLVRRRERGRAERQAAGLRLAALRRHVRQLQPDAVIFSDAGPDVRWVGNERGEALADRRGRTIDRHRYYARHAASDELGEGTRFGEDWVPPSATSRSVPAGSTWVRGYEGEVALAAGGNLRESVGRNCTLLLNVPPDRRGLAARRTWPRSRDSARR